MRGIALSVAVVLFSALALVSCGGEGSSPLDDALGYLPADASLAVAISTDLESDDYSQLDAALQRFGVEGGVEGALEGLGEYGEGPTFSTDIRPLLGNELVVGVVSTGGAELEDEDYVAALAVDDAEQARDTLGGIHGLEEKEGIDGATIYGPIPPEGPNGNELEGYDEEDQTHVAVDGDVVVVAQSLGALEDALAQRDADGRLTQDSFEDRLAELPSGGIVRAAGDIPTALEALGGEHLGTVPWIGALRSFGLVAAVGERELTVDASVAGDEVAADELPLAPGPDSPKIVEELPSIATLDQSPTIALGLEVIEASVPAAAYKEVTGDLEERLGDDLGSLADAFGEGVSATRADGEEIMRSEVRDPALVSDALRKLRPDIPRLAQLAGGYGPAADALDFASVVIPALPIPPAGFGAGGGSGGFSLRRVAGEPDLYRLLAPRPAAAQAQEEVLPPPLQGIYQHADLGRDQFVFGLLDDTFVTASSVDGARQAARLETAAPELPGAVAVSYPVDSADLGIPTPEGGGVTLTVIDAGIEASGSDLRLRLTAGL